MTHLSDEQLVLLYYREPGIPVGAEAHLAACGKCRAEFAALAETLNACLEWNAPEPDLDYSRSVWAQLAPHITESRKPLRRWWPALAFAAVALLVVSAFWAGRWSRHPEPGITAGLSPAARERILAISMADHLDRAEILLTGIENGDDTDAQEFAAERQRARDLVSEGRLMRQMVADRGDAGMLPFLDEIERMVLEVANTEPGDIREVKRSIGADSLLFKVRIIESNLRSGGEKL